jgi:hypothetical protein
VENFEEEIGRKVFSIELVEELGSIYPKTRCLFAQKTGGKKNGKFYCLLCSAE